MSQENVELAYRAYGAVNRRDLDGFLALMDDEVKAVSFLVAMEGEYRATLESAAGGRTCSTFFPTSMPRLSRCATLEETRCS